MTTKINPLLMGAFACTALLLEACGGSDPAGAPQADIAAMAGLYKVEAGPAGNTVSATVIADDQGHFIGTSFNLLPDYAEGADFSGVAGTVAGAKWSAADSTIYTKVSSLANPSPPPAGTTTSSTMTGTFAAGTSFTYSIPNPPLPNGYPSAVTLPRVTIPPGPYTLAGLAGHYGPPGGRTTTPTLLDITIDTGGHASGTIYTNCNFDGTVTFLRPDINVLRLTGTFTNCYGLNGVRTLLGDVLDYDTPNPWVELWRQPADGSVFIVQGIKQ
jgi:hypothetical protein